MSTYEIPYKTRTDCYTITIDGQTDPCHYCGKCAINMVTSAPMSVLETMDVIPVYSWDMQGDERCDVCGATFD